MTDVDTPFKADLNDQKNLSQPNESSSNQQTKQWTGSINLALASADVFPTDIIFNQLCHAYNKSPFFHHCGMTMRVVDGQIQGVIEMNSSLIGNVVFEILHGGVAATMLDSIGGIVAMAEIYRSGKGDLADRIRQVTRLATTDMRVDYLAPGRGKQFIATAEVLRLGRKGCTMRMNLHNDERTLIATAIATYVY
ncbi:MAG: thioesterase family protein [Candidatus Saccharibacteria bacterium]|nr:thioesterase family protein [Moraxellaceae bacterium]